MQLNSHPEENTTELPSCRICHGIAILHPTTPWTLFVHISMMFNSYIGLLLRHPGLALGDRPGVPDGRDGIRDLLPRIVLHLLGQDLPGLVGERPLDDLGPGDVHLHQLEPLLLQPEGPGSGLGLGRGHCLPFSLGIWCQARILNLRFVGL